MSHTDRTMPQPAYQRELSRSHLHTTKSMLGASQRT